MTLLVPASTIATPVHGWPGGRPLSDTTAQTPPVLMRVGVK